MLGQTAKANTAGHHIPVTSWYLYSKKEAIASCVRFANGQTVITGKTTLNEAHTTANKRGDLETVFPLNDRFHSALFGPCNSKELLAVLEIQARRIRAIRTNNLKNSEYLTRARESIDAMIADDHAVLRRLFELRVDRPMQD